MEGHKLTSCRFTLIQLKVSSIRFNTPSCRLKDIQP